MPGYELSLILRVLNRVETVDVLKSACYLVIQNGGIVRTVNNVGTRQLPYRIRNHGKVHKEGQYYTMEFDSPVTTIKDLREQLDKQTSIIRPHVIRRTVELDRPCNHRPCHFGETTNQTKRQLHSDLASFVKKV